MSPGLQRRSIIQQGKPFVQFGVMSFARDKWDEIAELTSCTTSTATKILGYWTGMHRMGLVQIFHVFWKQLLLLKGFID